MSWTELISERLAFVILTYSIVLLLFYLFIAVYSFGETRRYLLKNKFTDYRLLASSAQFPSVSILAPAYNEASTIVENVKSLITLY